MNFKVGQQWKTRNGDLVTIAEIRNTKQLYPVILKGGGTRTLEGKMYTFTHNAEGGDLLVLAESAITPHIHAALIKQWADGAKIQWKHKMDAPFRWRDCTEELPPLWYPACDYRVKPASVFVNAFAGGVGEEDFLSIDSAKKKQSKNCIGVLEFTGDDVIFHKKEQ